DLPRRADAGRARRRVATPRPIGKENAAAAGSLHAAGAAVRSDGVGPSGERIALRVANLVGPIIAAAVDDRTLGREVGAGRQANGGEREECKSVDHGAFYCSGAGRRQSLTRDRLRFISRRDRDYL